MSVREQLAAARSSVLGIRGSVTDRLEAGIRQRDPRADALKGFAILLVVVGHAIQVPYRFGIGHNLVFRFIYSFHMPLFMFVSGYVAALSTKPANVRFISNKAVRLVLPFLTWHAARYLINARYEKFGFVSYWHHLLLAPDHDHGLWFLWVLFLCFCLLVPALRLEKHWGTAALALALVFSQFLTTHYAGLAMVKWFFPFFVAGYVFKRHAFRISWLWSLPLAAAFIPLALIWERRDVPDIVTRIAAKLTSLHFGAVASNIPDWYHYLTPFAGIAFAFALFRLVKRSNLTVAVFSWLGARSLTIYCAEFFFLGLGFGSGLVYVLSHSLVTVTAALILGAILSRFWLTNLLFLGTKPRPRREPDVNPKAHDSAAA
ncbi:MAG: acyltransferase family protein [Gaiellaceae bacterium]